MSERRKMIETIEDLIQSSHKAARSQYTPSAQRAKWTRPAGQLIWYKEQILRGMSLEATAIDQQILWKRVEESIARSQLQNRDYPMIVFSEAGCWQG